MSKCKVQILASVIAAGFLIFLPPSPVRADSVTLTLSGFLADLAQRPKLTARLRTARQAPFT